MLSTWFRSKSIVSFVLNKSFKVLTLCHNGQFAIRIQPKTGNLNFRFERQMDTTPDEGVSKNDSITCFKSIVYDML